MIFRILTLFPEMFDSFLQTSIIGKAVDNGMIQVKCDNIRAFSDDKHHKVDDYPFGGGAGMVLRVQPLKDAIEAQPLSTGGKVIYLSPRGKTLTHDKVVELSKCSEIVLICGHYEGVDQRFIDAYVDEELSIGDYVLTGGELAAMVVIDSVSRLVTDVLKNDSSAEDESFTDGLLEYPHYTRPAEYDGKAVPPVLLSGNHAAIAKWRLSESIKITKTRRPDLFRKYISRKHDKQTTEIIKKHL